MTHPQFPLHIPQAHHIKQKAEKKKTNEEKTVNIKVLKARNLK